MSRRPVFQTVPQGSPRGNRLHIHVCRLRSCSDSYQPLYASLSGSLSHLRAESHIYTRTELGENLGDFLTPARAKISACHRAPQFRNRLKKSKGMKDMMDGGQPRYAAIHQRCYSFKSTGVSASGVFYFAQKELHSIIRPDPLGGVIMKGGMALQRKEMQLKKNKKNVFVSRLAGIVSTMFIYRIVKNARAPALPQSLRCDDEHHVSVCQCPGAPVFRQM